MLISLGTPQEMQIHQALLPNKLNGYLMEDLSINTESQRHLTVAASTLRLWRNQRW